MKPIYINNKIQSPENVRALLLDEYGISTTIRIINNTLSIKIDNHISLATIIKKVKNDFDFHIIHPKGTDEYIMQIL